MEEGDMGVSKDLHLLWHQIYIYISTNPKQLNQ